MPLWLKGLGLFVLIGSFLPAAAGDRAPSPRSSGPELVVSPAQHNLGDLIPGQRAENIFSLRNAGSEPLTIKLIRTSSDRLTTHLGNSYLAPGSIEELRVVMHTNLWDDGALTEQVLLYTDNPDQPLVKVKLEGVFQDPLVWTPKSLDVGIHRGDPRPLPSLRIRAKDGQPIGPLRITSFTPFLQADIEPDTSESQTVRFRLDPSIPLGMILGWIRIETSHPARPLLEIAVRGQVLGDLVPRPYALNLGIMEEGKPATSAISLLNLGKREVHIVKTEAHLPTAVEVGVSQQGKDYRLDIHLHSPPPHWRLDGHINVYTDHPLEPVVQVPVVGWVWSKAPFERVAAEGDDAGLLDLIKAALFKDERDLSTATFLTNILGGVRDDRAASLLLRALADDNWAIRPRVVEALGFLHNRQALEPLRRAITHDRDDQVRLAATTALVRIAGREALPELLLAIQDDDNWVREDAAKLLMELNDPQAIPALKGALEDEDEQVREAAREALHVLAGGMMPEAGE